MSALTKEGWPRPIIGGWPIPWVSPPEDLSQTDGDRLLEVIANRLCQVCGLPHAKGERVFLCVSAENEGTNRKADLNSMTVFPMDNAVMHERCARLAVARCPALRDLAAKGALIVLSAPSESVGLGDRNGRGDDHLAVEGSEARIEDGFRCPA